MKLRLGLLTVQLLTTSQAAGLETLSNTTSAATLLPGAAAAVESYESTAVDPNSAASLRHLSGEFRASNDSDDDQSAISSFTPEEASSSTAPLGEQSTSQEDPALQAALAASMSTAEAEAAHRVKMAAMTGGDKSVGHVCFESICKDASEDANSDDLLKIQEAINRLTSYRSQHALNVEHLERLEGILIRLALAMSVLTNHEKLGA